MTCDDVDHPHVVALFDCQPAAPLQTRYIPHISTATGPQTSAFFRPRTRFFGCQKSLTTWPVGAENTGSKSQSTTTQSWLHFSGRFLLVVIDFDFGPRRRGHLARRPVHACMCADLCAHGRACMHVRMCECVYLLRGNRARLSCLKHALCSEGTESYMVHKPRVLSHTGLTSRTFPRAYIRVGGRTRAWAGMYAYIRVVVD